MCEFISAVKGVCKGEGKWYFLTYDLIHNTPLGKGLQKKYGGSDLIGHTAIREFFALREGQGENVEYTDFSSPDNFPPIIAKAIKNGDFKGLMPLRVAMSLLSTEAQKGYASVEPAYAKWIKADTELSKAARTEWIKAYAEWKKAYAEWEKAYAERGILWDLFAIQGNRVEDWRD